MVTKRSSWPNEHQELLLQAALLDGSKAIQAWEKWNAVIDLDDVDYGSHRLLPLLYRNLTKHGVDHITIDRLKGVHRLTWYKNTVLLKIMEPLVRALNGHGIRTIILKGAALLLLYYKDFGLRPMSDFDLLIPTDQAPKAIKLLKSLDWRSLAESEKILTAYLRTRHAYMFVDPDGNQFDLHWHLLMENLEPRADDDFWDAAMPLKIGKADTLTLAPADHLFHACMHGVGWNDSPPLRWIADAFMILRGTPELDWDRLLFQAKKRRLALPLREALFYVRELLEIDMPPAIVEQLQRAPISRSERREFRVMSHSRGWMDYLQLYWFRYKRAAANQKGWFYPFGFIKYLQLDLGIEKAWQVPIDGVQRLYKRVRKKISYRTLSSGGSYSQGNE